MVFKPSPPQSGSYVAGGSRNAEAVETQGPTGLETIPEGSNETDQSSDSTPSDSHFLTHEDKRFLEELEKIQQEHTSDDVCWPIPGSSSAETSGDSDDGQR